MRWSGRWAAVVCAGLVGCGGGGEVALIESADAGGIDIRATAEESADSVRVTVQLTNTLDTSAHITLNGGCPITVITYAESEAVWDEREGLVCEEPDIHVPLAPGELELIRHNVAGSADPSLQSAEQLGVRVLVAVDEEYMLEAERR